MAALRFQEERARFEQIYLAYGKLLYTVAFQILNHRQDAEDAVSQAFVKIAENIHKLEGPENAKTKAYVVAVAQTKALDLYRAKQRHPKVSLDALYVEGQAVHNGEDALAQCMTQLPVRYRQVLLLKYKYGFTTREIGKIMEISPANAAKLEQRAKAKLEDLCKEAQIL